MVLLALPAGALADRLDRRRLLMATQTWMLAAAGGLGVLTFVGLVGPWGLLGFTFLLGLGGALNGPAWQSIVPELVDADGLPSALALNSVGFNLARAVGPALGGVVVALAGASAVFLLNAVSYLGVVVVLYRWRRQPRRLPVQSVSLRASMAEGVRFARRDAGMKAVLARGLAFVLGGSGLWALLPLLARHQLGCGSRGYGVLLGCLGAGAVMGAWFLPRLRQRISTDRLVTVAAASLAGVKSFEVACPLLMCGGGAWIAVMANLNLAAQKAVPGWARARGLSVYMIVSQGGLAVGGVVWGTVASQIGTPPALALAALAVATGLSVARCHRLPA
jgi:MFS family permease